jgi:hypothetical protein
MSRNSDFDVIDNALGSRCIKLVVLYFVPLLGINNFSLRMLNEAASKLLFTLCPIIFIPKCRYLQFPNEGVVDMLAIGESAIEPIEQARIY